MTKRVAFAAVAIPVLVGVIWFGVWPLAIILALASLLATRELFAMVARQDIEPFTLTAAVAAIAVPVGFCIMVTHADWAQALHDGWPFAMVAMVVWVMTLAVFRRAPASRPLAAIAVTLFAMLYTTILPATLFYMRHAQWPARSWIGTAVVFFPLIVTWVCDSAAMFGGRIIGGAKLAPSISPGKTQAGAIAGVIASAIVGALYAVFLFPRLGVIVTIPAAAAFAAVLAVVGQIGDLAESLLKREAGVKDSSTLIPGHGGVLDRLDSLYFVLPIAMIGYHLLGVL